MLFFALLMTLFNDEGSDHCLPVWNRGEDKVDQAQTHLLQVSIRLWRVFIIRFSQDASMGCSSTQRIPIELQSIALVDTNSEY